MIAVAGVAVPASLFALEVRRKSDNVGPLAISGLLTLVGPATGRWYAGRSGWQGMALRYSGFMLFAIGFSDLDEAKRCQDPLAAQCEDVPNKNVSWAVMGVGATTIAASTIYDIVTTPREVRSWRERQNIKVIPLASLNLAGLAIDGRF